MAELQEQGGEDGPSGRDLELQIRFLPEGAVLYMKRGEAENAPELPPDEKLAALRITLRCRITRTSPGATQKSEERDLFYVVDGRIGVVPSREDGRPVIRLLMLKPASGLAETAKEYAIRKSGADMRILIILLAWPDVIREAYGLTETGRPIVIG